MGGVYGTQLMSAEEKRAQEIKNNPYGEASYLQQIGKAAMGQGPSAAQVQAQQNLTQAMAQARGMAAAQRGINPALAARQAAQAQGQMAQQGAVGAAQLRAQEQLGAMGEWGQQITGQRQANTTLEAERIRAQAAKDLQHSKSNTGMLGGLIGGIAGAAMTGGNPAGAYAGYQAGSQMAYGGEIPESQQNLMPTHDNQACYACGGPVPHYAFGSPMIEAGGSTVPAPRDMRPYGEALSAFGKSLQKQQGSANPQAIIQSYLGYADGGQVNMTEGGQVPGQAMVQGDSYANDVVPAMLSPREIVLPRTVTMGADAGDKAKAFVEAIKARYAEGKK